MITISKKFTILCLLCLYGNRKYAGSFQKKSVSSPSIWMSRYVLLFAKQKRRGNLFFVGTCKKEDCIMR